MSAKEDFSPAQWENLLAAPRAAGLLVVFADTHITGMASEFRALWDSLTEGSPGGADPELVTALIADLRDRETDEDTPTDDEDLDQEALVALITAAAALVDAVCPADEAAGYKDWVIHAARATAEASRESWFFGIGGPRVSEKERDAMAEIEAALGR